MGIIVISFPGCGKSHMIEAYGTKIRILDAFKELAPQDVDVQYDYGKFADDTMKAVGDYDIVFIPAGKEFVDAFNEKGIDYDIFYPSKERRNEFIENLVRKRVPFKNIMFFDRSFDKMVDDIDGIDYANCYKHKMSENGQYIGNDASIVSYVNNLLKKPVSDEKRGTMEESSGGGEHHEGHEEGDA